MMEVLEPDEIIMDGFGEAAAMPTVDTDAILAEIDRLMKEGKLKLSSRQDALPMLALGAAGGIIGASFFRGTLGLMAGGVLAWWAWSQLSK